MILHIITKNMGRKIIAILQKKQEEKIIKILLKMNYLIIVIVILGTKNKFLLIQKLFGIKE